MQLKPPPDESLERDGHAPKPWAELRDPRQPGVRRDSQGRWKHGGGAAVTIFLERAVGLSRGAPRFPRAVFQADIRHTGEQCP